MMSSQGDPLLFMRGLGGGVPKTRCSSSRVQQTGEVRLSVTGTPFSLVRKMLPFTGTWVLFYDIV